MTSLILDDELLIKLAGIGSCVELRDANGNTVGFFTPIASAGRRALESKVSEEELDRREQESETFSPAEVRAHLESL